MTTPEPTPTKCHDRGPWKTNGICVKIILTVFLTLGCRYFKQKNNPVKPNTKNKMFLIINYVFVLNNNYGITNQYNL